MKAAIDRAESDACRFEEAEEQAHKELRIAFLIALTGAADKVPAVVDATMFKPRRIGQINVSDAIADACCESIDASALYRRMRHESSCALVAEYFRAFDASNRGGWEAVDAAELKMFAESECPHVKALRVALADAYASLHAGPIAELEELEKAHMSRQLEADLKGSLRALEAGDGRLQ